MESKNVFASPNYAGHVQTIIENQPHLGGNIKFGDPYTSCPTVWDYLLSRFGTQSVLDIGSGTGNASDFFYRKGVKVIAIDGLQENIDKSIYPTVLHDLTVAPVRCKVDLVYCQEVVEHIEEKYLDNILKSLCCGKIIVMTHALPGQEGYHHVNLQPPQYWIDHLQNLGCYVLAEDTNRIRLLAERDGAIYMKETGLVFANYGQY
ncbi:class I SAM-dependent methyltransferase [Agrobacterium rhizogenes]|uniref:Methyltransferase domain protein n=1 Tax=Rhizobium rhizogenes TaxID=359 RepID=A0A7S5DS60_RHIRH|nr:methyltransferase domain-containing protein [Rhizobium rhizogenes]NTF59362.1 class I SAM-dependent methyltransferase [Rhizobium rhizogenes]NTF78947.1 class I SAM-dependent methyltransferase [Rhizobium rhizogenes]NTJ51588.1 class I SAM-dependent methyltransferase [Rhizobium rhizogenes]QCL10210.1 methyltransferase domain protein [Rhizobium rhizogenes]